MSALPVLVAVARFDKTPEAHILRGRLWAEGIPSWIVHEFQIANDWVQALARGGVQVQVRGCDFAEARTVVADSKAGAYRALLDEPDHRRCPKCGASDYWKRRPLLRRTAALAFGLFAGRVPPLLVWIHFCNVCGTRFRSRYGLIGKAGADSQFALAFAEAGPDDLDAMMEVRLSVEENALRVPPEDERAAYEALLAAGAKAWLCRIGGFVRGFVVADPDARRLAALFVQPAFKRDGIGRYLHNVAVDWLFAQGAPALRLATEPATAADLFFRKAGWRIEDRDGAGDHLFTLEPGAWARRRKKF